MATLLDVMSNINGFQMIQEQCPEFASPLMRILISLVSFLFVFTFRIFNDSFIRPWSILGLDIAKQAIATICTDFFLVLTIQTLTDEVLKSSNDKHFFHPGTTPSVCAWYTLLLGLTTILNTALTILFLYIHYKFVNPYFHYSPLRLSGDYGQEVITGEVLIAPSLWIWMVQMLHFLFACVVPAQIITFFLIQVTATSWLSSFMKSLTIAGNDTSVSTFHLLLFIFINPLVINIIQYMSIDKHVCKVLENDVQFLPLVQRKHVYDGTDDNRVFDNSRSYQQGGPVYSNWSVNDSSGLRHGGDDEL